MMGGPKLKGPSKKTRDSVRTLGWDGKPIWVWVLGDPATEHLTYLGKDKRLISFF